MNPTAPSQPVISAQPSYSPPPRFSKKVLGIIVFVFLIIALPIIVYVVKQQQTLVQQAAPANTPPPAGAVASVYGRFILQGELDAFATELGETTPEGKKKALDMLIERKVLDEEAKRAGIGVSDQEVTTELTRTNTQDFEKLRPFTKYVLLQQKIIKSTVQYIEADIINFWLPPLDYPVEVPAQKKQQLTTQRAQAKEVLDAAQTRLAAKEDPVAVARDLVRIYPAFQDILALNGNTVAKTLDDAILRESYIHVLNSTEKTSLGSMLEGMNVGEVKQLEQEKGAGGMVAQVINKRTGIFNSYEEWLANTKESYVKVY